jgi:hypothetical protein
MDIEVQVAFKSCLGPWSFADEVCLTGGGVGIKQESHISLLHSMTIMNIVLLMFQDIVLQHLSCERMREISISSIINNEKPASGFVDRCFTLEFPPTASTPAKSIKCCWFDDKNVAVLKQHEAQVAEHIKAGRKLLWEKSQESPIKLLLKVDYPNTIKRMT